MRAFFMALVLLFAGAAPGLAQSGPSDISTSDRGAIMQVIRQQMAAFQHDDAAAAFSFAAPSIQGRFGNDPDQFLSMVRQGYPPVYRPRQTAFGSASIIDGSIVQPVDVEGPDGVTHTALYTMEREPDGTWRISSCVLTDSGDVGA